MGLLKKIFLFQITVLGLLFIPDAQAQVTIGNADEPIMGSLLDLKKNVDNENNVTADKGLGLSRVMLTNKSELYPMFDSLNLPVDYADQKKFHKGLTVWNVNEMFGRGVGTYVWSGSDWNYTHGASHYNFKHTKTAVRKIKHAERDPDMYLPNCYMVHPGEENKSCSFTFPVRKAYAIWQNYKTPAFSQPFPNKKIVSGECKAMVVWQDNSALIDEVEISSNSVDYDATITIRFNGAPTYGNAVVALTIDGIIYWSWHIWYTPYKPDAIEMPNKGAYGEYSDHDGGGSVFYYNNGTLGGDYIFMDRNLGANATTTNIDESWGHYYQWGRKDPFPSKPLSPVRNLKKDIYDIYGRIIPKDVRLDSQPTQPSYGAYNFRLVPSTSDGEFNLLNTIFNPLTFYGSDTKYRSWYTNREASNLNRDLNFDLWDESGRKGPFDPCPQGWRVPLMTNRSPWFYEKAARRYRYKISDFGGVKILSQKDPSYGGFSFEKDPDYNMGFYPVAGYMHEYRGEPYYLSSSLYWVANNIQPSIAEYFKVPAYYIMSFSDDTYFANIPMSTAGFIRCVKDMNED